MICFDTDAVFQFSIVITVADQPKDGTLSIIPSGPAVGFVEETTFNLTCTSRRSEKITWTLPKEELDNFPSAVSCKLVTLYGH